MCAFLICTLKLIKGRWITINISELTETSVLKFLFMLLNDNAKHYLHGDINLITILKFIMKNVKVVLFWNIEHDLTEGFLFLFHVCRVENAEEPSVLPGRNLPRKILKLHTMHLHLHHDHHHVHPQWRKRSMTLSVKNLNFLWWHSACHFLLSLLNFMPYSRIFRLFEYGGILSLSCWTPVALFIKFWLWCSECNVAE